MQGKTAKRLAAALVALCVLLGAHSFRSAVNRRQAEDQLIYSISDRLRNIAIILGNLTYSLEAENDESTAYSLESLAYECHKLDGRIEGFALATGQHTVNGTLRYLYDEAAEIFASADPAEEKAAQMHALRVGVEELIGELSVDGVLYYEEYGNQIIRGNPEYSLRLRGVCERINAFTYPYSWQGKHDAARQAEYEEWLASEDGVAWLESWAAEEVAQAT